MRVSYKRILFWSFLGIFIASGWYYVHWYLESICREVSVHTAFKNRPRNIIILANNALRPDHLGCYGYGRATSPNIDRFAHDGTIFTRALSHSYWTLPNLISLLTGHYPSTHTVLARNSRLSSSVRTLTQVLHDQGYLTAAFTCGIDAEPVYGLEKGFDFYYSHRSSSTILGGIAEMMPEVIKWVDQHRDTPFFLFVHGYDLHSPYVQDVGKKFDKGYRGVFDHFPLEYEILKSIDRDGLSVKGVSIELDEHERRHIVDLYDNGVQRIDSAIGRLLRSLRRWKVYEDSLIIICADHGEELGERGTFDRFSSKNLYNEVIKIPLIVKPPKKMVWQKRNDSLVGLIDITPTLLHVLEIAFTAEAYDGRSFLSSVVPGVHDQKIHTFVLSEGADGWWAWNEEQWKYLHRPGASALYDSIQDPDEQQDLSNTMIEKQIAIMKKYYRWKIYQQDRRFQEDRFVLPQPLVERLKKAGYWHPSESRVPSEK